MRPKTPFEELEQLTFFEKGEHRRIVDYPFKQLIGVESRLQRTLKKKDSKIEELKETIKAKVQSINREKMAIKGDLKNIRLVISEKTKDPMSKGFDDSKFTILRGGKYVRAKIRIMGRVRWLHIGRSDKWVNKSDKDILEVCRSKLTKHFTANRS